MNGLIFVAALALSGQSPKPQHLIFDDEKVEGEFARPDDTVVDVRPKARMQSLLPSRDNFLPELIKSTENR